MSALSYTPLLRLVRQAIGSNSRIWGEVWNNSVEELIDTGIAGVSTISLASGSVTLTRVNGAADTSRAAIIMATGAVADASIVLPASDKLYIAYNATSFVVTFKTPLVAGVAIAAGEAYYLLVMADGTVSQIGYADQYVTSQVSLPDYNVVISSTAGSTVPLTVMSEGGLVTLTCNGHSSAFTSSDWTYEAFNTIPVIYQPEMKVACEVSAVDIAAAVVPSRLEVDAQGAGTGVRLFRLDGASYGVGTRSILGFTITYPQFA